MSLGSMDIPLPSEVILPFAGFLAYSGRFDVMSVILVASFGDLFGSLINYWVAYRYRYKAVTFLERFRLVDPEEIVRAGNWLTNHALTTIFVGRMLPIIRTFISFPAGMFKVNIKHFTILTFIGSFIWCSALTLIGYIAGSNWITLEPEFRQFDYLILGVVIIGLIWEIRRRFKIHNKSDK